MTTPFAGPTPTQEQQLIVLAVGDFSDNLLSQYVSLIWSRYGYVSTVWPQLQRLYTQRDMIEIALGRVRDAVNFSLSAAGGSGGSTSVDLSTKAHTLMAMRKDIEDEIVRQETLANASQSPQYAPLTTIGAINPTYPNIVDGNDPRISGSIYPSTPDWPFYPYPAVIGPEGLP